MKGDSETAYRTGNVNITKANVGLGNVPNVATNDQTPTYTTASANANLTSGEKLSVAMSKIAKRDQQPDQSSGGRYQTYHGGRENGVEREKWKIHRNK